MEISANPTIWSEARQWRREQPKESVTNKLAEDKPELEDEIEPRWRFEEIIGKSPALMRTLKASRNRSSHGFDSSDFGRNGRFELANGLLTRNHSQDGVVYFNNTEKETP